MKKKRPYIWVTRPQDQAQHLSALLEEAGFDVFAFPALIIEKLEHKKSSLPESPCDHLIVLSANAVIHGQEILKKLYRPNLSCIAIGKRSAQALLASGYPQPLCPQAPENTESLLNLAPLKQVQNKIIHVLKGHGGRDLLIPSLEKRGAIVSESNVYQRLPHPGPLPPQAQDIDAVIFTSLEGLENACALWEKQNWGPLSKKTAVVLSQRISLAAKKLGFEEIRIADYTEDRALLEALIKK